MKVFIKVILLIFMMALSSCYQSLEYKNNYVYPNHKNDEIEPAAVVINVKLEGDDLFIKSDMVFNFYSLKEIEKKIKYDIDSKIERPFVYFYYSDKNQLKSIKSKFDKVIVINLKINKSLNFTGVLDILSIYTPIPAPQWGNYTFNAAVEITSKNNKKIQKFNYIIVSDFSYMFFPLWRIEPQIKAVRKGINKLLTEMLANDDLVTLFNKDGEISFTHQFAYSIEETGGRLIQRDHYSDYPFAVDIRSSWGLSQINGYYTNDNGSIELGASGEGFLKEYHIQASTFKPTTKFVVTPTLGYYYQDIEISDFGQDTSGANYGKVGYIPGKVEEVGPDGEVINSTDNLYSLGYQSQFSSTYLGGKIGLNLIYGDSVHFIFSPLFYFSLIEARHTTIIAGGNEFSDWTFPLLGMLGFNFETGLFFSKAHFGFKLGYDIAYFRRFDFAHNIMFNSTIYEDGLLKSKKIEINKFDVISNKFFIDFFILF